MRSVDLERLWRDSRPNPTHEGTSGIQRIDLVGRKILADGVGLPVLGGAIAQTVAAAEGVAVLADHACAAGRPAVFDNATAFPRAFGHVVMAWLWLDQAIAADGRAESPDRDFVDGKLRACRFFFECELPKVNALLAFASRSVVAARAPAWIFRTRALSRLLPLPR